MNPEISCSSIETECMTPRYIWEFTLADKSTPHNSFPTVPVGVVLLSCGLCFGVALFLVFRRRRSKQPPQKKEGTIQHVINSVRHSTLSSNRVNPIADNDHNEPQHASNGAPDSVPVRSRSQLHGSEDGTPAQHTDVGELWMDGASFGRLFALYYTLVLLQ